MNVRFPPLSPLDALGAAGTAAGVGGLQRSAQAGAATGVRQAQFSSVLENALKEVSQSQLQSGELQKQVQLENPKVGLEETMIAMQKSQIHFQAALQAVSYTHLTLPTIYSV